MNLTLTTDSLLIQIHDHPLLSVLTNFERLALRNRNE